MYIRDTGVTQVFAYLPSIHTFLWWQYCHFSLRTPLSDNYPMALRVTMIHSGLVMLSQVRANLDESWRVWLAPLEKRQSFCGSGQSGKGQFSTAAATFPSWLGVDRDEVWPAWNESEETRAKKRRQLALWRYIMSAGIQQSLKLIQTAGLLLFFSFMSQVEG